MRERASDILSAVADPRIGTTLDGRYQIVGELAAGGMCVVYRGERLGLGRSVAIKFLHAHMATDKAFLKRFAIEARAMAKLQHAHCAAVIDYGVAGDEPYVVMDLIGGESLRSLLDREKLPASRALGIMRQVLSGLAHAHAHGITHRDIKPDNIMVEATGSFGDQVRILDFGLAKLRESTSGLTTGFVVGTPSYMAPEQTLAQPVDERTDIYACGVVLFEMLTGTKPFRADEAVEVLRMHREVPPPRLADVAADTALSDELDGALQQALAKDASHRFASAAAFATALDHVPEAAARPGSAPPMAPASLRAPEPASASATAVAPAVRPSIESPLARQDTALSEPASEPADAPEPPATGPSIESRLARQDTASPAPAPSSADMAPAPPIHPPGPASSPRRRTLWLGLGAGLLALLIAVGLLADDAPHADVPDERLADPAEGYEVEIAPDDPEDQPEQAADDTVHLDEVALAAPDELAPAAAGGQTGPRAADGAPDRARSGVKMANQPTLPSLAQAQALLDQGRAGQARKLLEKLRIQDRDDAQIHYLLGKAYFEDLWVRDGLASFRQAIALDGAYRSHHGLIESAAVGLANDSHHYAVSRFLVRDIGQAARPALENMATRHHRDDVRERASRALRQLR